jgi:hypothetical protein
MSLADSIRQTAWIAPCASDAVTASDQNIFIPPRKVDARRHPFFALRPVSGRDGRAGDPKSASVEEALHHRHLLDTGGEEMDGGKKHPKGGPNEGEGSKATDERCRQGATDFARRTDTVQRGIEAERDVENYRDEYERAEKAGRSRSAGDLETDLEGKNDDRR